MNKGGGSKYMGHGFCDGNMYSKIYWLQQKLKDPKNRTFEVEKVFQNCVDCRLRMKKILDEKEE